MKAVSGAGTRPVVMAFVVWFVHFMLCWAAVEIWPHEWRANGLAWVYTGVALLAIGMQYVRLERSARRREPDGTAHRLARGGIAIAAVAVVFTALPSFVLLP